MPTNNKAKHDAIGGGQSPNSNTTGREVVISARYVQTKQIFVMESNISCQKAFKASTLLTIICRSQKTVKIIKAFMDKSVNYKAKESLLLAASKVVSYRLGK